VQHRRLVLEPSEPWGQLGADAHGMVRFWMGSLRGSAIAPRDAVITERWAASDATIGPSTRGNMPSSCCGGSTDSSTPARSETSSPQIRARSVPGAKSRTRSNIEAAPSARPALGLSPCENTTSSAPLGAELVANAEIGANDAGKPTRRSSTAHLRAGASDDPTPVVTTRPRPPIGTGW